MSDDEADIWPVLLSEIVGDTLSDPDVSPALFSVVVALTVAVCENPWLEGSNSLEDDPDLAGDPHPRRARHRGIPD